MRYAQIRDYDVANGLGVRTTIFVTGCTHNCYNCFNKEYQDFTFGNIWTQEETTRIHTNLAKPHIKGLSLLGGEPLQNRYELIKILDDLQVQDKYGKDIWVWSGYTFEQILLLDKGKEFLDRIDILVDGLYIEGLKDLSLRFRGSANQRIIDVQKSLKYERVITLEDN